MLPNGWLLNVTIELPDTQCLLAEEEIGIDLGLKEFAVCSDGTEIDRSSFYRKLEPRCAKAQRAGKKRRVKAVHRKIENRRKDKNRKISTEIARKCGLIVVKNVSASKLPKTKAAHNGACDGWEASRPTATKRTIEHRPDRPLLITCRIDLLWYGCPACMLATSLI